jgi:hypothetical protein
MDCYLLTRSPMGGHYYIAARASSTSDSDKGFSSCQVEAAAHPSGVCTLIARVTRKKPRYERDPVTVQGDVCERGQLKSGPLTSCQGPRWAGTIACHNSRSSSNFECEPGDPSRVLPSDSSCPLRSNVTLSIRMPGGRCVLLKIRV